MARRLQAYLHQNRLGTFNFRWRPPRDVADCFAQSAFEFSLATKNRSEAWHRALSVTLRVRELLASVRAQTMAKPKPLTFELVRSIVLPDRTEHRIDYDPNDPAEVAEADRIVNAIQREAPSMLATADAAASLPPAGTVGAPARGMRTRGQDQRGVRDIL